ncbi:IS66 family transposase [Mailhella massiliensis]|uniref:IS66 family transposase n=1 Tax=Mailhella massiliensis TaxID=1903261 RepID=A0A921AYL0_9BACT|nr:IS66 family transposase [Mailhella massiliensis]HJD98266.1 IS66 family transposase [Mailhella massiliensis]
MKNTELYGTSNTELVTISRAEYEKLLGQGQQLLTQNERISHLENQVDLLMEALRLVRHKQFGASSEKCDEPLTEQLSFLFNEVEVFAQPEKEEVTAVAAHTRHKKHEYTLDNIPEGMPTEVVEHRLEGDELVCPKCGDTMTEIGVEVVKRLKIEPIRLVVEEHRYHTYACRTCDQEDIKTPVIKAPREKNIIPGSFATPEAIAHIMTQKFVMGSPLYRQEQELRRQGISLSRQTMSNWILRAAEDYLTPVYEQMHKELLGRAVLHADETTLQVLHEPDKKPQSESYMWLYRTSGDTDKPIVLYEYQPGRGARHPKAFLTGFRGYLHTDGYAGYHNLSDEITVVGCWAHARRKFDEAVKSLPKGKAKGGSATQGLAYCNKLFELEDTFSGLSPEERYVQRLEQAKPVLDALLAWANTRTAAPKSALGKAFTYLKEQWPYLVNYLRDGRLEISNNRAERSIKPFVIDRKNFLFANTPKGAAGSAVIFSMIQTALENQLDPYRYLTWLLKMANGTDLTRPDILRSLLPWKAPETCKVK